MVEENAAETEKAKRQAEFGQKYMEMMNTVDSHGLTYVANTAQLVAYERAIESKREDRLFNDHLAQHFVGERGEEVSRLVNNMLADWLDFPNVHMIFTPCRTKLINDNLDKWVEATAAGGQKMQVTNMGAGVDTRAFWLDSLAKVERYVEVDVESMQTYKTKKLEELKETAKCER